MTTPDIVLSFALWLRRTRNSLPRRLLFRMKDLGQISLWDIGESGGFFHRYENQHEKYTYTNPEFPASRDSRTQYYSEGGLPQHRPQAYNFTNSSFQYPLLGTARIFTCPRCHGTGKVTCSSCGGSGSHTRIDSKGNSYRSTCLSCFGSGKQTCSRCSGEGQLLTYTSKDYIWKRTVDREPILSSILDRSSVRGLIINTHNKGGSYPIEEFSREEILQATGVYNERIESLIQHAREQSAKKEREINERFGIVLFQRRERFYVPLGFINLFVLRKFGQYFIAGNLTKRLSRSSPIPLSFIKLLGWLSIGVGLSALAATFPGYLVLNSAVIQLLIIGLIGVSFVVSLRFGIDFFVKWPSAWLIADDDGLGGWLATHLFVQSISLTRKGKLLDPCYTELFYPPEANTRKSRNSFFCTLEIGQEKPPKLIEICLLSQRALTLFREEIQELAQNIDTLIWVIRQTNVAESDRAIAGILQQRYSRKNPPNLQLILLVDRENLELSSEDFPETTALVPTSQIRFYSIPLSLTFGDLQQGRISAETQKNLDLLGEILQPRPALPSPPPSNNQPSLPGDRS